MRGNLAQQAVAKTERDEALVVDKRRRGKRRLIDLRRDDDVDVAAVDFARPVEIGRGQAEVTDLGRVVRVDARRDGRGRKRTADGIGAIAGRLDVDDLEPSRQRVAEVHPQVLQVKRKVRIDELRRIALRAEAQIVDDVIAVALDAGLFEEWLGLAPRGIGVTAPFDVEASGKLGRLGRGLRRMHGGEREPGRHQPARWARGV